MRFDAVIVALALGLCSLGVGGGDPHAASALWQHAVEVSGGDLSHELFIDAQRELARLRPWQEGYAEARLRMGRIGEVRATPE